ncbi:MAG TPA: hypothetical protein VLD19_04390, partial [Chitinophagaceae bacterium]|nr:hypothetical protein [Chitinophagaceae bacterium]
MVTVKEHQALWDKIQSFSLDDVKAVVKFSDKLAAKQNWAPPFTQRAIEEYRKFILLCCISEKGASPSHTVDEVWHLHLTYTQSYWVDFCKNTLGRDLHHHPSAGGEGENHKHEEWYKETLAMYETVFGMMPPTDIWPRPKEATPVIETYKPKIGKSTKRAIAAFLTLPFLFLLAGYGTLNPYSLNGEAFLLFYPAWGVVLIISYSLHQWEVKKQLDEITAAHFPEDATVFQMAKFLYGKHRALQTAVVDLMRRRLLVVDKNNVFQVNSAGYIPEAREDNPLVPAFVKEPNGNYYYYDGLMKNWYSEERFSHPALEALFAFAFRKGDFLRRNIYPILFFVAGAARSIQGILN